MLINGYTDKYSYEVGDIIKIYLNYSKNEVKNIVITDLNGKIITSKQCNVFPNKENNNEIWQNGANYKLTCEIKLDNFKSGIYLIENKISFVVKDSKIKSDFLVVYESLTVEIYNSFGGKNGYKSADKNDYWLTNGAFSERANILNFQRPKCTKYSRNGDDISHYCKPFLKWMLNSDYNVKYISDLDLEGKNNIQNSNNIIICGHSEYWTMKMKNNIDEFVDKGNNLIILSGNTMWWNTRFEDKINIFKEKNKDPINKSDSTLDTINFDLLPLKYSVTESTGLSFRNGGITNSSFKTNLNKYKIINSKSPLLEGVESNLIDAPFNEADGAEIIKINNEIYLLNKFNFYKYELIAYDSNLDDLSKNMSFIAMQRFRKSGIIINTGNMNWCSDDVFEGNSSLNIKKITKNILDKLLNKFNIFTNNYMNSININRNILNMYDNSLELNKLQLDKIPIRGKSFSEVIKYDEKSIELKVIKESNKPGIFTKLIEVDNNNSYILKVKVLTKPNFLPLTVNVYDCNKKNYESNNYLIQDNGYTYFYFETKQNNNIYLSVGLKNPYKDNIFKLKSFEFKKVNNSKLYNINESVEIDFIKDNKSKHLLKSKTEKLINKNNLFAVISLNNFKSLQFSKNIKRDIKYCSKKYYCKKFNMKNYIEDFVNIRTSSDSRQGRKMDKQYLKSVEELGGLPTKLEEVPVILDNSHYKYLFGVFQKKEGHKQGILEVNEQLLGYISLIRDGDIACFSEILGHKDYLSDNIMTLLQYEIMKLESNNKLKYLFYGNWNSGVINEKNINTLQNMKERLLFRPLQFEIKNNFEIGKDNYEIDKVLTNNQNTIITRENNKIKLKFKQNGSTPGFILKKIKCKKLLNINFSHILNSESKKNIIIIKDIENNNILEKKVINITENNNITFNLIKNENVVDIYILYDNIKFDNTVTISNININ